MIRRRVLPVAVRICVLLVTIAAVIPLAAQQRFRILFGGADATITDWSGSLSAASGEATIVASHHFGPDESFDESSWQCGNQWDGKLQMEPRDRASFSPARWKGVIVDIVGGGRDADLDQDCAGRRQVPSWVKCATRRL